MDRLGIYLKINFVSNLVEGWVKAKPDNKQLRQVSSTLVEAFAELNNQEKIILEQQAEISKLTREFNEYKNRLKEVI
jgi:hypothetical protein